MIFKSAALRNLCLYLGQTNRHPPDVKSRDETPKFNSTSSTIELNCPPAKGDDWFFRKKKSVGG